MTNRERVLRRSLRAGALYDLGLGLFILLLAPVAFRLLGHAGAPDTPFFALSALPLFILPLLYWSAASASNLRAFRVPVLGSRSLGGLLILIWVVIYRPEAPGVYAAIAGVDWVWALLHFIWWRGVDAHQA